MIRLATRSDLNLCVDLIHEFLQTTSYANHIQAANKHHLQRLIYAILQGGYIWLYYQGPVAVGILVAVKEQNVWIPEKVSLRELVWYVREEFRGSPSAGRLFVHFCKKGEELMELGQIDGYFTTRMATTTDYDLEKRGFRLTEKLYLRD